MNRICYIIIVLLTIHTFSDACTIGVAAASTTSDGRPVIWKNRDVMAEVVVYYYDSFQNKFIGVGNENSEYIWMGVNEHGFAILNSLAEFPEEGNFRMGNGDTMKHALANFSTIVEFEAFLDSTNITGRETHANMAVLDSTGAAVLYEVSNTNYWKFDTADAEQGFIVRGVFAFNGGGTTSPNYERSGEIIGELVSNNDLNVKTILQQQIREFNDAGAEHIPIPFAGRWSDDYPFGYIPFQGINNVGNGSAVVIQGIRPDEPVDFMTMWTVLGLPSTVMAFPCFPVGPAPLEANDQGNSTIFDRGQEIKNILCDHHPHYIDSYKLINSNETGYWTQIFPQEEQIIQQVDSLKQYWLTNSYEIEDILDAQNEFASQTLSAMNEVILETEVIPNFKADIQYGIPGLEVYFEETSLHFPGISSWQWDFNNDGTIDFDGIDTVWTFNNPGNYTVSLEIGNGEDFYPIQKENYIIISNSLDEIIDVEPDSLFFQNEDDLQGLIMSIHNNLEFDVQIDSIEWDYFEPSDLEFPITISENESLYLTIFVPVPISERDIIVDHLIIDISNGMLEYPIYADTDIYSDVDNPDLSHTEFYLSNYPNPFSTETTISFSTTEQAENTEINIYNIKGQKIETFKNLQIIKSPNQQIVWNAEKYPSGIYFYRQNDAEGNMSKVKKMVLIK